MQWYVELLVSRRWLFSLCMLVVTALAGALASQLEFDEHTRSMFAIAPRELAELDQFASDFGSDENDCVVLLEANDLFTYPALAALRRTASAVRQIDGVESVVSMCNLRWASRPLVPLIPYEDGSAQKFAMTRQQAFEHPLVPGNLLSADGNKTVLVARLAGDSLATPEIQQRIARIRQAVANSIADSPLTAQITGLAVLRGEIASALERDVVRVNLVAISLAVLLASIIFRNWRTVLIAFVPPIVGSTWSLAALQLAGEKLNVVNAAMPTLVLVIGLSDSIHLVWLARKLSGSGIPRDEVAKAVVRELWLACGLTAFATSIGFGSLIISQVEIIRRFGVACAVACVISYLAIMTTIPLLLCSRLGNLGASKPASRKLARGRWMSFARALTRFPRLTAGLAVAATVALVVPFSQLRPDYSSFDALPKYSESAEALRKCDQYFGGAMWAYVVVEWPQNQSLRSAHVLQAMDEVHQAIDRQTLLANPISLITFLGSMPGKVENLNERLGALNRVPRELLRRMLRTDLQQAVVALRVQEVGTSTNAGAFANLEFDLAALQSRYPDLTFKLTGTTVLMSRSLNQLLLDLRNSLTLDAAVIFVALTIGFRSIFLGLASIVPNMFPLFAAGACLVWLNQPLDYASAVVFSVCLGIAVDDTVHFITRFGKELKIQKDVQRAVETSFAAVGIVAATTTCIFLVGFGSLAFSEIPLRQRFAALSALILVLAWIGDFFMLPSLLVCLGGRRVPSRFIARLATYWKGNQCQLESRPTSDDRI